MKRTYVTPVTEALPLNADLPLCVVSMRRSTFGNGNPNENGNPDWVNQGYDDDDMTIADNDAYDYNSR